MGVFVFRGAFSGICSFDFDLQFFRFFLKYRPPTTENVAPQYYCHDGTSHGTSGDVHRVPHTHTRGRGKCRRTRCFAQGLLGGALVSNSRRIVAVSSLSRCVLLLPCHCRTTDHSSDPSLIASYVSCRLVGRPVRSMKPTSLHKSHFPLSVVPYTIGSLYTPLSIQPPSSIFLVHAFVDSSIDRLIQ